MMMELSEISLKNYIQESLIDAIHQDPSLKTFATKAKELTLTNSEIGQKIIFNALARAHIDPTDALFKIIKNDENAWLIPFLASAGADLNAANADSMTPLLSSASMGNFRVAHVLILEGVDVNSETYWTRTPLHEAAMSGHVKCLLALVKAGANLDARDQNARTPMHLAAISGDIECIKILIRAKADINPMDFFGKTPLQYASEIGYTDIVNALKAALTSSTCVIL